MVIVISFFIFIMALVASVFKFKMTKSMMQTIIVFFSIIFIGGMIIGINFYSKVGDFDVLNGSVVSKARVTVPCEHSYSCNCYVDSKGHQHCSVCYMHPFDYDWRVKTTVGTMNISRVDSQGAIEPKRFTQVVVGEPASVTQHVINYLKGSSQSLYSQKMNDMNKFKGMIPAYPKPYDYYRDDHVLGVGYEYPEVYSFNQKIADTLKKLGPSKQVNVVVVVAHTSDENYKNVLENHWMGGKKNDVVVVIGVPNYPNISWVEGFSYAKSINNSMLFVTLRDDLKQIGDIQKVDQLTAAISNDVEKYYNRYSMKHFEYLTSDINISLLAWVLSIFFFFMLSFAIFVITEKFDTSSFNRF